jgi:phosphotransferase system enzyme I (PtsI)
LIRGSPLHLHGIGASPGVAVGRAYALDRSRVSFPKQHLPSEEEVVREQERLATALSLSDSQLAEIREKVSRGDGAEHALILEAHRLMLKDTLFADAADKVIAQDRINAEWAVKRVVKRLKAAFENLADEYFRERRGDIDFVGDRVVRNLMGHAVDVLDPSDIPEGSILVGHELTPADAAMLLVPSRCVGFITEVGGHTSHTAIVARAREIPGVVGVARAAELIRTGDLLALDGIQGMAVLNPTDDQVLLFREAMRRHLATEQAMLRTRDLPTVSADQVRVGLFGNMEFGEEVPSLLAHGAEGVGLYRTEFLYLGREDPPSEEEHYKSYRSVLAAMEGRPVTIRTLDMGADKVPRGPLGRRREREPNPALGLRAVRYCLKHRELFHAQLRGLLRASVHGNLRIMFPMICGLTELREARAALERAKEELARAGQPFAQRIPVGIMVETPAAAAVADKLAQESDFFSLGTNDLIQYSLAIDRQNREVAYLYRPLHLAILRQIKFVVESAHQAGIRVSMCGEMAGDPLNALILLGLGLDEFSMAAAQVPIIKRLIRHATAEEGRALLAHAMTLNTAEEIERFVRAEMQSRFGDALAAGPTIADETG